MLQTPIPSRRADALVLLEEAFPGLDPSLFEVKTIQKARLKEGRPGLYPGMRSMLDIVMEGTRSGLKIIGSAMTSVCPSIKFAALAGRGN